MLCISFIMFLTTPPLHAAEAAEPSGQGTTRQEILILNSYHPGFVWSDDEQAGVIDVFRAKDKNWRPVIEYLDLKRLPDGRHLAELKKLFLLKYQNKKFSVVIPMDNSALEFAIDNQEELFRNAPIVFCGINNYTPSMLKGRSEVTGIVEAIDLAGTIEVMLRLHPTAREIFSPHDYTATGLAVRKELEALVPRFAKVRFRFNDPLTMEELLKEIEQLPKDSLILEIGFIADKAGRTFDISETTKLFYEHSPVPIYSTYEQRLGFGIVGGKLLGARIHGANAARIALRVLAGEKVSAIPVVFESDSKFMFDYKVTSRFGIPLSALPEGSTVINKPVSFYAAHREVIQAALGIISFLLIVTILLTVNIIQRRRSAEVIRRSEEMFKVITTSTPDHLLVQDSDLRYSFVMNPQLGLTEQDMIGKTDHDFLSEEDADKLTKIKRQVLKTGSPMHVTLPLMPSGGEQQFFDGSYIPKFDAKGHIDGLIGYFRNVTKLKRAEVQLREGEEKYRNLFNNAEVGMFRTRLDGSEMLDMNERFLEIFDRTRKEMRGTPSVIYWANPLERQEIVRRLEAEGRVQGFECGMLNKQGETRRCLTSLRAYREQGILEGSIIDITALKRKEEALRESESRYRTFFDKGPDGVVILDPETIRIIEFNDRAYRQLGYSREEFAQLRVPDIEVKETAEETLRHIRKIVDEGFDDFETLQRTKQGEIRHVHVTAQIIETAEGKVYHCILRDITERKRTEEELRASQQQYRALAIRLQQIREEERIMISREIHDVMGGGLTGLKMDLSWLMHKLENTESDKERIAMIGRILESSESIDQMIRVVRRISTELRPPVLDDLGLIAALEWQLSEFTSRTGIPHELATAFEYVSMEADTAIAVFRIFQEALTNVVRHSRATKLSVVLREEERSLSEEASYVLEIRDNGRGITKEEILNPESLGLLGMRERVLAFGGELSICGAPAGGTTMVLKIPRKQGEPS